MQSTIQVGRPLTVQPGKTSSDQELEASVGKALAWHFWVPRKTIHAEVHDGWATLSGTVEWLFQRTGAEEAVAKVEGLRGITNGIRVECRTVSTHRATHCVTQIHDETHNRSGAK